MIIQKNISIYKKALIFLTKHQQLQSFVKDSFTDPVNKNSRVCQLSYLLLLQLISDRHY